MERGEELKEYFKNVGEDKQRLAYDCIDEYCCLSDRIDNLKALPFIRVSKKNPEIQEMTPAAKLFKDYSQAIDNKRKTLLMILYRSDTSAADELLEKLKEFE